MWLSGEGEAGKAKRSKSTRGFGFFGFGTTSDDQEKEGFKPRLPACKDLGTDVSRTGKGV